MQQPPFDPHGQPNQPFYPQQPNQPTEPFLPQPGHYPSPGFVPPTPPRRSKRRTGCIIASSIAGGLIFLLTLCIVIGTLFPPPKDSPGANLFANPTPTRTVIENTTQTQATAPTTVALAPTPTAIPPTPTLAPPPTPIPTPIPTPTPRPGPSRAQVDELINKLHGPDVKSYDEKTGTLVVATHAGYAIVVDQKFVRERMQEIHEHIWQSKLYFASVTVEYYHNRRDTPPVKLAYSIMKWARASTIDWGALFGVGDLWDRYDEKWMSSNQADFDGQGL